MKKIGISIRNSDFARWLRTLPAEARKMFKVGYQGFYDPDEITRERFWKKWLSKNPKK